MTDVPQIQVRRPGAGPLRPTRNDTIQALRGIAALLVVVTHSILTLNKYITDTPQTDLLAFAMGELGVKTFFVISGFIMTMTMYGSFGEPGAPLSFLRKRLVRIAPLYWLATLIYVAKLAVQGTPTRLDELAMSLAFIPYNHVQEVHGPVGPVYGLGWTLNYEMFFYCVFALALSFRRRFAFPLLFGTFIAFSLIDAAGLLQHCSGVLCDMGRYYADSIIYYFAGGVVLALARIGLERNGRLPAIDIRAAIIVTLVAVFSYACIVVSGSAPEFSALFTYGQVAACVASAVCCGLALSKSPHGRPGALLLILGDASYSIYLTHSFLIGPAGRLWGSHQFPGSLVLFTALMIVGSSLLGIASYRFIEVPTMRILRSRPVAARPAGY